MLIVPDFFSFAVRTLVMNVLSLLTIGNIYDYSQTYRERSSTFPGKGTYGTAYQKKLGQFVTACCKDFKEAKGGLVVFKTTLFSPKFHRTIGLSEAIFGNGLGGPNLVFSATPYHRLVPFLDLHPPSFSNLKNAGSENFRSWYSQKPARWCVAPQKRYATARSYAVVHRRVALQERYWYDLLGWCV
jgi:hypothetical protein